MLFKRFHTKKIYPLTNQGIEDCIEKINAIPGDSFENEITKTSLRLKIEEALLRFRDHFGDEREFELYIHNRFGKYTVRIAVYGEHYNPRNDIAEDADLSHFAQAMSVYGSLLTYDYKSGKNQMSITFGNKPKLSRISMLAVSILCGVLLGWIGKLLPETVSPYLVQLIQATDDIILGLISFVALPIVFLSVFQGITACGSISNLGQRGVKTIKIYLLITAAVLLFTSTCCCFIFPLNWQIGSETNSIFDTVLSMIVGIFPTNLVKPFLDGNLLQVVLIGLVTGCAVLVLNDKDSCSLDSISKLSDTFNIIMQWFCKFIPVALTCMLSINVMDGSFSKILDTWPIFAAFIAYAVLILLVTIIITSKKTGLKAGMILKGIFTPMIVGLSTASSAMAFPAMKNTVTEIFGVDEGYASFAIPIGISFLGVGATMDMPVILLFMTHLSGMEISVAWVISAILLCFVFSIAVPPVSGGAIAVMTMLFEAQGLGDEWLSMAFVSIMLLEYLAASFRVSMLPMISTCKASSLNLITKKEENC